ncbi:MAG: HypC/HybG/HupF family hydrogenase formation chaperone [Planctomycetota bacterium]
MCVAIPARVVEVTPDGHFAVVDFSSVRRTINVDLLAADGGVATDEWVLVHAGFAMAKIDAAAAAAQLEFLRQLGEASEELEEFGGYSAEARE